LDELAIALASALVDAPGEGVVWLGAHVDPPLDPEGVVIYQTECLEAACWDHRYRYTLAHARAVWDYSLINMGGYYARQKVHVPIGRSQAFDRPVRRCGQRTIDVGFVGSLNERRRQALAYIDRELTSPIQVLPFGTYGAERDAWVSRCKVIVCPHYYPNAPAEQVRIVPITAAGVAVVGEYSPDCHRVPGRFASYGHLRASVLAALEDFMGEGIEQLRAYAALPTMYENVERALACMNQ
jgi:hypothetical protein